MVNANELINLYEHLVRDNYNPHYKLNRSGKVFLKHRKTFKKLKEILSNLDIPPREFLIYQFQCKGTRPYPNQLISQVAIDRWKSKKLQYHVEEIHHIQEKYLEDLMNSGFSLEDALKLDIFYYYFRCLKLENCPKKWELLAKREVEKFPELKKYV